MLIFGEDGKAQLIEANGTNGLTVTTIAAPATSGSGMSAGVTRTDLSTTTTPQTPQVQGTPSN